MRKSRSVTWLETQNIILNVQPKPKAKERKKAKRDGKRLNGADIPAPATRCPSSIFLLVRWVEIGPDSRL